MFNAAQMDKYLDGNYRAGEQLKNTRFATNDWEIGFVVKDAREKRALLVYNIMTLMSSESAYTMDQVPVEFNPKTMQPTKYKQVDQPKIFSTLIKCIETLIPSPNTLVCSEMGCTIGDKAYSLRDTMIDPQQIGEFAKIRCVIYALRYDIATDKIQVRFVDLDRDQGEKMGINEEHDVDKNVIDATDQVYDEAMDNWKKRKKQWDQELGQ